MKRSSIISTATSKIMRLIILCYLLTSLSILNITECYAQNLVASWYSCSSLKKEGTWKKSHGRMANNEMFYDDLMCCANRLYPLGTFLRITNLKNGKMVTVKTTDRIGKRFASTRIDLSKGAFAKIADIKQGIIPVKVEVVKKGGVK